MGRYCIVCEADAAGEKCAKCGSNTFAKNDPEVRALFAREGAEADEKSEGSARMAIAFFVGAPIAIAAWFAFGWIGGIAAGVGASAVANVAFAKYQQSKRAEREAALAKKLGS